MTDSPRRSSTGLCPRCGSPHIFRPPNIDIWRCEQCEKIFPTPSYGSASSHTVEKYPGQKEPAQARRVRFPHAEPKGETTPVGVWVPVFMILALISFVWWVVSK